MTASIVIVTNPFEPVASRSVHAVEAGITVGGLLQDCGIAEDCWSDGPEILIGGMTVPVGLYAVQAIGDGEVVTVIRWPQGGGGGGGGGKNPMRIVLTIAVMVAAIYLGPMAAVVMGYTATGTAAAMATAGIAMVGSVLINTVIPAPSPTYSLQAQGNQGRLGQPIPVIYGRHLIYPDLASEPYQDYVGGEQYLYQLHVIGQGDYAVEQIRIEDTPISSFEEVQTEIVPPGFPVTLFEPDVITAAEIAGQELVAPNLVASGDDGFVGPFTANPVDTTAGALGIDVVMPRGLYYANDGGSLDSRTVQWQVEARAIDADGAAIASWSVLATESYSAATNTAIRLSFRYAVSSGRYEVRLKRLDTKDTAERAGHVLQDAADHGSDPLVGRFCRFRHLPGASFPHHRRSIPRHAPHPAFAILGHVPGIGLFPPVRDVILTGSQGTPDGGPPTAVGDPLVRTLAFGSRVSENWRASK